MDSVITKFSIGDLVKYKKTSEEGKVVDIVSTLGGDDNVYEVLFGNVTRLYSEKYLDIVKKYVDENKEIKTTLINDNISNSKDEIKKINVDDVNLSFKIEDEINKIINELNLVKVNKDTDSIIDACKLLKYLATRECNINCDEVNTNNIVLNELYKGLFNRDDNYITNSYLFSEILKRVGVNALNVGLKDDNGNFYMANLVLIKGLYYYFDVTVEQAIFNSNGRNLNNFKMCSACIGSETYEKYFTPVSIIDINPNNKAVDVPDNISKKNMDPKLLNKIVGVIL